MNTSNMFGIKVTDLNAEIVQRLAFGFGYKWEHRRHQPEQAPIPCPCGDCSYDLLFDTKDKLIMGLWDFCPNGMWDFSSNDEDYSRIPFAETKDACKIMELFKNPPVRILKIGDAIEITMDGSVKIVNPITLTDADFNNIVIDRNNFLGRNMVSGKMVPVVCFDYSTPKHGIKNRRIAVMEQTDAYLAGKDIDDENRFKKFLFERMITNPIYIKQISLDEFV